MYLKCRHVIKGGSQSKLDSDDAQRKKPRGLSRAKVIFAYVVPVVPFLNLVCARTCGTQFATEQSSDQDARKSRSGDSHWSSIPLITHHLGRAFPTRTRARGSDFRCSSRDQLTNSLLQTMYEGVLRDDERRKEKQRQRTAELEESRRKREMYEGVQNVHKVESGQ